MVLVKMVNSCGCCCRTVAATGVGVAVADLREVFGFPQLAADVAACRRGGRGVGVVHCGGVVWGVNVWGGILWHLIKRLWVGGGVATAIAADGFLRGRSGRQVHIWK